MTILSIAFGAFCGLLFGILTRQALRFLCFLTGHYIGGKSWAIGCMVAGAALFAWLALSQGAKE